MESKKEITKDEPIKWKVMVDGIYVGIVRDHRNLHQRIQNQGIKGVEIKPVYI